MKNHFLYEKFRKEWKNKRTSRSTDQCHIDFKPGSELKLFRPYDHLLKGTGVWLCSTWSNTDDTCMKGVSLKLV